MKTKTLTIIAFVGISIFFTGLIFAQTNVLRVDDVRVSDRTASSTLITWTTNRPADATVNYGLLPDYGIVRSPLSEKTEHEIKLTDLLPSTTYYFRVVSADADGDRAISSGFQFTTEGIASEIPGIEFVIPEEMPIVERTVTEIKKITDPQALELIASMAYEMLERLGAAPSIIGLPRVDVRMDSVLVEWETDIPADSFVALAPSANFNPTLEDPYTMVQGTDRTTTRHQVEIIGLNPGTVYHFQVRSRSEVGLVGRSEDETFKTMSPIPEPFGISIDRIEETSVTISWNVSLPAAGIVEYTNLNTGQRGTKGNPDFLTRHTVQLANLDFNASYSAIIIAENEEGERSVGGPISFSTRVSTDPPEISNISSDLTLYPGDEARVQALMGWTTDTASFCDLYYQQGIAPGTDVQLFERRPEPSTNHLRVITAFAPATIYKYWIECEDRFGNFGKSEDFVLLTPQREKSIIDIIIENFELAFGWLGNMGI